MTDRHSETTWPPTEERNPRTIAIDQLPTIDVLRLINAEDATVAPAVARALPSLAAAADLCVEALRDGCALHYFGAGTSGRMAVLDAAELRPTFGVEPGRVVAHIAGGPRSLTNPSEAAEDDEEDGAATAAVLRPGDVALGTSASGTTPYVAGALRTARANGAGAILVSANPRAPLAQHADVFVAVDTGPEAITGSTRMKAGTAQKLVLNALSTTVMVRLGRTYSNLMIDMQASNAKLRDRRIHMLAQATGADPDECRMALEGAGGEPKVALVTLLSSASVDQARRALGQADGYVRLALTLIS